MGVYSDGFALAHRDCGELRGDADPFGYRLWIRFSCGARLQRWITPSDAEAELLRSALVAFEN